MAEGGATQDSVSSSEGSLGIKAILIGATGAIGECLLGELVASKNYSSITVLGRREAQVPESYGVDQKAEQSSGRLQQHVVDFENISGDTKAFQHIDYDYVVNCAKVAKDSGVQCMSYVSSVGANPNSWFLYPKTKGQVEEALKDLKFQSTSIFRPGLLDRGSKMKFAEKVASVVMSTIAVADVAKAMRVEAEKQTKQKSSGNENNNLYFNADIFKFCSES